MFFLSFSLRKHQSLSGWLFLQNSCASGEQPGELPESAQPRSQLSKSAPRQGYGCCGGTEGPSAPSCNCNGRDVHWWRQRCSHPGHRSHLLWGVCPLRRNKHTAFISEIYRMHQLSMSVKALDHVERVRLIHGRGAAGNWKLLSIRAEQSGLVRSALQSHSPSPALWQFAVPPVYLESRFPDGFIPSFSWCSIGALRMCYWFVCCLHATELGDFGREEVREALLPSGLSNGMRIGCITSCAFDLWQVNSASWFSAHHLFILWCKEAVPLHRTVQCPASQNCTYRELFGTVLLQVSSKSSVGMNLLCNTVSPAWTAKYRLEGGGKHPM